MTLEELRRAVAERQAKSVFARTKKAIKNIPNASTRFQLELELAARQAISKEIAKQKEKFRGKNRSFLQRVWRGGN